MEHLTIDDIEPWLLSGKPVVRLQGRDFGQTVDEYEAHVRQLCESLKLGLVLKRIAEPPGVVLAAHLGTAPELVVPLIKVSKTETPWLFCIASKCRNRVSVPGSTCEAH